VTNKTVLVLAGILLLLLGSSLVLCWVHVVLSAIDVVNIFKILSFDRQGVSIAQFLGIVPKTISFILLCSGCLLATIMFVVGLLKLYKNENFLKQQVFTLK